MSCKPDCCNDTPICDECPSWARPVTLESRKYQNIKILLDMSDRLNEVNQIPRDKEILSQIYKQFVKNIKVKGFQNSGLSNAEDIFDVSIAAQSSTNNLKLKYEKSLSVDYSTMNPADKPSRVKERDSIFSIALNNLYDEEFKFKGSIFSNYFYNASKLLKNSSEYDNILIVLTDGESDNLKVEINQDGNLDDFRIYFIEVSNSTGKANELVNKEEGINNFISKLGGGKANKILANTLSVKNVIAEIFEKKRISNKPKAILGSEGSPVNNSTAEFEVEKNIALDKEKKIRQIEDEQIIAEPLKGSKTGIPKSKTETHISDPQALENVSEGTLKKKSSNKCPNEGKLCDDDNDSTEGDIIRSNCKCEGTPIVEIYYKDIDGDKIGDPSEYSEFQKGKAPKRIWVANSNDKCPTRDGKGSSDGCPKCSSELQTSKPLIDQQVLVSMDKSIIKASDQISWTGPPEIKFDKDSGSTASFRADVVGKYTLNYSIKGTDGFNKSCSKEVCIEMTPDQLKQKLIPLLKYGMLTSGSAGNFKSSAIAATKDIKRNLSKSNIMIYDEINSELNPFDTFLAADLLGSRGEIIDLEVISIRSNEACKIDKVKIKLTRK